MHVCLYVCLLVCLSVCMYACMYVYSQVLCRNSVHIIVSVFLAIITMMAIITNKTDSNKSNNIDL